MEINKRVNELENEIFDNIEIPKTDEYLKISKYLDNIIETGVIEETDNSEEEKHEINNDKVFGSPNIIFSFMKRTDIINFILNIDWHDIISIAKNKELSVGDMIYTEPVIKTIINNMKINFDFRFYIGDINRELVNSEGLVNEIPRYYPNIYKDATGKFRITRNTVLEALLASKGIEFETMNAADVENTNLYNQVREEDIPESLFGIYEIKESNFERLILNECKKDVGGLLTISEKINDMIELYRKTFNQSELFTQKKFIDELSYVIKDSTDQYGNIADPVTQIKTGLNRIDVSLVKNLIKYTKERMIKSGKIEKNIINDSMYLIKHISMEDIIRRKTLFVSDYYLITENPDEYKHIKDNVYIINSVEGIKIKAFSEKYDYVYIPMCGVIHKVECIKDNKTEIIITYKNHHNELKRVMIPERLMKEHNIYVSYQKALEDGGQKESIEERMFMLKLEELRRKHEQIMLSKITIERKSKIDLITKMLKIIETENDQSTIIKMLEIEKQTLANQNANLKNTKDGYDFIKTVARDVMRHV